MDNATYKNSSEEEINLINETISILKLDKSRKMVLTSYSFFSAILNDNLNSPSRWFISNGGAYPIKNNKYFSSYKKFFFGLIERKKIDTIYVIFPVKDEELLRYINIK